MLRVEWLEKSDNQINRDGLTTYFHFFKPQEYDLVLMFIIIWCDYVYLPPLYFKYFKIYLKKGQSTVFSFSW